MHTAVQKISRAYSFHLTEMCLLINNSPLTTTPKTLVTTILVVDFMNLTTLSTSLSGIIQYFICLVYFTRYNILQVHPCCYMLPKFLFVCFFFFKLNNIPLYVHVWVLSCFTCVQLFATPWTCPADSSVHGILQARIVEWFAISSFRASSRPRDWTHVSCVSCIERWILYPLSHLGTPWICIHFLYPFTCFQLISTSWLLWILLQWMLECYYLWDSDFTSFKCIHKSEIAGSIILFLILWGSSILSFRVAAPFCTLNRSVQVF